MGKFYPEAKNMIHYHYRCRLISNLLAREVTHPQTFHPIGNLKERRYHYCSQIVPNQTK